MNKKIDRVLIVRLSALGDIVNSSVVLQFIRASYPNASIEWLSEELFSSLLLSAKELDKVHTVNIKKLKKEKSFSLLKENVKKLKSLGEFDLVIDMQGLLKSAIVARLVSKRTHGFDKNSTRESLAALFYKTTSRISYESDVVKRNCFLVSDALGFSISQSMVLQKEPVFNVEDAFVFQKEKKNIGFVIGASWPSKIYPKEQIVNICNSLAQSIYIIWGNLEEKERAEWICKHSRHAVMAPKLSLEELVSFISALDLVIGNDTGPTHLAWAQNIASITLLGPTTTRMIQQTPKNIGIKSPSKVDILKIDKNDFSIQEIPENEIILKAKELLYGL